MTNKDIEILEYTSHEEHMVYVMTLAGASMGVSLQPFNYVVRYAPAGVINPNKPPRGFTCIEDALDFFSTEPLALEMLRFSYNQFVKHHPLPAESAPKSIRAAVEEYINNYSPPPNLILINSHELTRLRHQLLGDVEGWINKGGLISYNGTILISDIEISSHAPTNNKKESKFTGYWKHS